MYHPDAVLLATDFMQDCKGSYSKLADHLNLFKPRPDGSWTKDQAYHLCRINGIRSTRRCKSQPSAGHTQRNKTRQAIITATLDALTAASKTIADIAPVQFKEVVRLSGAPLYNVRNNWCDLEGELNDLAGL